MASNSFGTLFRITTWGESHGKAIGVVIDGCPAGLPLDEDIINAELAKRRPGNSPYTSPRKESDRASIYSGTFEGKTTGAPISIIIPNKDARPRDYESMKHTLKPGHAHYTYLEKYGVFDYRGGGRASARETACRVAAGAVAKQLLAHYQISVTAYLAQVGSIVAQVPLLSSSSLRQATYENALFCPDAQAAPAMTALLEETRKEGDSIGGVVAFVIHPIPAGLGEPVYEKLEAKLAHAMLSLPATKAFEIGAGFAAAAMQGSEHNDGFTIENKKTTLSSNTAGGTLGGISTGMPVIGRVAFKPASSISKPQSSITVDGEKTQFILPEGARHDPCVAIRAVPVVEAMAALVIADLLLFNRGCRL